MYRRKIEQWCNNGPDFGLRRTKRPVFGLGLVSQNWQKTACCKPRFVQQSWICGDRCQTPLFHWPQHSLSAEGRYPGNLLAVHSLCLQHQYGILVIINYQLITDWYKQNNSQQSVRTVASICFSRMAVDCVSIWFARSNGCISFR